MAERRLYVVPHAEATHHVEGVVGGWHDSALTLAGVEAAARTAAALRARIPEDATVAVFSSDLQRAAQTAASMGAELGVEVTLEPGLREKSYGVAEGRPQSWLDERFVPPPAEGERLDHDEGVEGAETKRAFAERVHAAMERVLASDAEHVVVVTHGFAVTFVITAWLRLPVEALGYANFRAPSGSITELREDALFHNRQVLSLGETGHLGGG